MHDIVYSQQNRHSFHEDPGTTSAVLFSTLKKNTNTTALLTDFMSQEAEMLVYDSDEDGDNDGCAHMIHSSCLAAESSSMKDDAHFYEWEKAIIDMSSGDEKDAVLLIETIPATDGTTTHDNDEADDPYWLETLAGDIPALQAALRKALVTNDVPTVQELINFGVIGPFNVNNITALCEHSTGRTPIWYAASGGSNTCIALLADWCYNSCMNEFYKYQKYQKQQRQLATTTRQLSFLTKQQEDEEEAKVKAHKEVTAFLDQPSKYGSRPILIATICNRPETVQTLLNYNVDVNSANEYSSTAALLAASEGHFEILNILAKHGANLDLPNLQGTTPVIVAAQNGRVDIIKFLYLYGVNLNHVNDVGMSCVAIAAYYNKPEVIEFLSSVASIDANAPDLNKSSGSLNESPLCISARRGNVEALQALLSSPHVNLAQINSLGMTALFIAAKCNQVKAVSAIINSQAARANKHQMISILNMQDKVSGMTPLFCALILGHGKVLELLAPLSDLSVLCGKDNSAPAILAAAAKNDYETCSLLLHAGAWVDQSDQMGHTALAVAARHGHVKLCELLVQHGAEIGIRSKKGRRTPLQKAKKYKHLKVVELFERYGAGAGEVLV